MHQELSKALLAQEVALANRGELRRRLPSDLVLEDATVFVTVANAADSPLHMLALAGENYNAEPLHLTAVHPETRGFLSEEDWPVGLRFGSPHPVHQRPFCCLRGIADYYTHPSHLQERWDRDRPGRRLDVVIGHLLDRMGVPACAI
jgi:hypothetical protein